MGVIFFCHLVSFTLLEAEYFQKTVHINNQTIVHARGTTAMTANSMHLQERQVINIADGKCLGDIKDIELNIWTGSVQALILPAMNGFWQRIQHSGELVIPWQKVVRIGVDVILVDMPELSEYDSLFAHGRRKRKSKEPVQDLWEQELLDYQKELEKQNIIVLNSNDYRTVEDGEQELR